MMSRSKRFYREVYLNSDHWQKLRSEKLKLNPACEVCKSVVATQVHHLRYKNLYDVLISDLLSVCDPCHRRQHEIPVESDWSDEAIIKMMKAAGISRNKRSFWQRYPVPTTLNSIKKHFERRKRHFEERDKVWRQIQDGFEH